MFLPFSLILSTESGIKSMTENCSVIIHWLGTFGWNDCLFVSNRFLIPMHDSIIIKISILSAWLCCFLCHFCNDTNKDCCFNQSTIHFENDNNALYYQWHIDHLLNIHKWWWLQSTNNNQIMVWIGLNEDCSIMITNWLLRIIKKIGFDSDTVEWFEWIDIWWLFHL